MTTTAATTITARTTIAGLHHWPDAPDRRKYLSYPHRHLFGVAVIVSVTDADRQVEWHDVADYADRVLRAMSAPYHPDAGLVDFGARSCEMIAAELLAELPLEWSPVAVQVDEDGEHTATVRSGRAEATP